jgi:hypothetical protein
LTNSSKYDSIDSVEETKKGLAMATNKPYGDNHRQGAVRDRSQVHNPHNDRYVKRNTNTGRFIDQKGNKVEV